MYGIIIDDFKEVGETIAGASEGEGRVASEMEGPQAPEFHGRDPPPETPPPGPPEEDIHIQGKDMIRAWRSIDTNHMDAQIGYEKDRVNSLKDKANRSDREKLAYMHAFKKLDSDAETIQLQNVEDKRIRMKDIIDGSRKDITEGSQKEIADGSQKPKPDDEITNMAREKWPIIVENVRLRRKSTQPAFLRWLRKNLWERPRDYVMSIFAGRYYRRTKAAKLLGPMVAGPRGHFVDAKQVDATLTALYNMQLKNIRLQDDHNKLILLLHEEGMKGIADKHEALMSETIRKAVLEDDFIPPNADSILQQHRDYLNGMITDVHFSEQDQTILAKLRQTPNNLLNADQKIRLVTLSAQDNVVDRIYGQVKKIHDMQEKLKVDLDLSPEEKDVFKAVYEHPQRLRVDLNRLPEKERKIINQLTSMHDFRQRLITQRKAEVFLLHDKQVRSPEKKNELLNSLAKHHSPSTGPTLMEGAEKDAVEALASKADEFAAKKTYRSWENSLRAEYTIDPSDDKIVVEDVPLKLRSADAVAIESLKKAPFEGQLRAELDTVVQKLQNRHLVVTNRELAALKRAAEVVLTEIIKESKETSALKLLQLESKNNFFPPRPETPGLIKKLKEGKELSDLEEDKVTALSKVYKDVLFDNSDVPERALLAVREYGHELDLPTKEDASSLLKRIESHAVTPGEYYTIMKTLEAETYYTKSEWVLAMLENWDKNRSHLHPKATQLKNELENAPAEGLDQRSDVQQYVYVLEEQIKSEFRNRLSRPEDVERVLDIIGAHVVGSTDFQRLQILSQMDIDEATALLKSRVPSDVGAIVMRSRNRLQAIKHQEGMIKLLQDSASDPERKFNLGSSGLHKYSTNIQVYRKYFENQLKDLNLDHSALGSSILD